MYTTLSDRTRLGLGRYSITVSLLLPIKAVEHLDWKTQQHKKTYIHSYKRSTNTYISEHTRLYKDRQQQEETRASVCWQTTSAGEQTTLPRQPRQAPVNRAVASGWVTGRKREIKKGTDVITSRHITGLSL